MVLFGPASYFECPCRRRCRDHTQSYQQEPRFQRPGATPAHAPVDGPEDEGRRKDYVSYRVADPPVDPNGRELHPFGEAGERQTGNTEGGAYSCTDDDRKRGECENVRCAIERALSARKFLNQVRGPGRLRNGSLTNRRWLWGYGLWPGVLLGAFLCEGAAERRKSTLDASRYTPSELDSTAYASTMGFHPRRR